LTSYSTTDENLIDMRKRQSLIFWMLYMIIPLLLIRWHSKKIEDRQGLFDMPTFIKSRKDNKKLYGKNAFCIKIYLKLMDVGYCPMPIKLRN
ncbi:hypothetical protein, partial [Bacillus toyonensis]|uniref:hypothetical protein n=2 Tax=Bacillus toyonensis TaxID=155322 RepID=UPI001C5505C8